MILRYRSPGGGVRDIDCGPSNGTHTRGPVSGGLVQPAPPIPSGRKGDVRPPRVRVARRYAPRCGIVMPLSDAPCIQRVGHPGHCKAVKQLGPIA